MLNSIKIQNYRNLKYLSIERLGNVNLIIGKNNTGKTSLLEAIYLLLHPEEDQSISFTLRMRGEFFKTELDQSTYKRLLATIKALFYEKNENNQIYIRTENEYFKLSIENQDQIKLEREVYSFPQYMIVDEEGQGYRLKSPVQRGLVNPKHVGFISERESPLILNSKELEALRQQNVQLFLAEQFINKKSIIIEALQIVDPKIIEFGYELTGQFFDNWIPYVYLNNEDKINLKEYGYGINRILDLMITLIACEDGYMLIDEFENGLHYSIQQKLWEIIIRVSEQLNIQVFATTHSNDTIHAFESIVNRNETNPLNGLLIKLENIDDNIEAIVFEPDELKVITDNLIEVRR